MDIVDELRELVVPLTCSQCGDPATDFALCANCINDLPWNRPCCPACALPQSHSALCARCARRPPLYHRAWSPLRMEPPVKSTIHGLKYHAGFLQAHVLGSLMAGELARRPEPLPQLLIPVPLYAMRLRRRGYNQALEVAKQIAKRVHIEVDAQACRRTRDTKDQIGMTAAQRRRNVRGAFAVTRSLRGLHVALLDDVMTTGATLTELARACKRAGATRVEVWAAARAP